MKIIKPYIAGILTGVLIASSISAFAAVKTLKSAQFNSTKIKVDGKFIAQNYPCLTVKTHQDKYAKTYATPREIAEALGAKVNVDDKTNTINIISKEHAAVLAAITPEFDEKTGLPYGATYAEYKGCKTAVKYKDTIYISTSDLKKYFNISVKNVNLYKNTETYGDIYTSIILDLGNKDNYFVDNKGMKYISVNLFKDVLVYRIYN